jgi:hypothetical protein
MRKTFIFPLLMLLPGGALAANASAEVCASALPAEARTIFEAAAPLMTKDSDMRAVISKGTIALVKAGRVARASAPDSAKAACQCLKRLNQ